MTVLILAGIFLAYANGANDNFKGVASLHGSGTLSYRRALTWATATTFAGSLCALLLASSLVTTFSGRGLVPGHIVESTSFLASVATGAGATVMLATTTGFPISTTHALTGALVGAGVVAAGPQVNWAALQTQFLLPLLLSPIASSVLAIIVFWPTRTCVSRMRMRSEPCVCVGEVQTVAAGMHIGGAIAAQRMSALAVTIDSQAHCAELYRADMWGVRLSRLGDAAHVFSAGLVGFARGLNDTPKITALLVGVQALRVESTTAMMAGAMAAGGVLGARRVADTMSHKITSIDRTQGFAANAATSMLVLAASIFGLPVSTTHVSVGALSGIGLTTGQANPHVIWKILQAWLVTLPCAAVLGAIVYWTLS